MDQLLAADAASHQPPGCDPDGGGVRWCRNGVDVWMEIYMWFTGTLLPVLVVAALGHYCK